jgi:hypothetical protein
MGSPIMSSATLGYLGPEDWSLQGLHLAPDAHGTQVSEDALAHVEVRRKGHVPLEVKAMGEAGLRQELFRFLRVVFRHRQVLPIPAQGVTDFRADPVASGDADALRLLACEELSVDGETDSLAHALDVEGAIGLVIAGEREPPGGGAVAVPAQLGIGHHVVRLV